jgi:phosphate transport system protein
MVPRSSSFCRQFRSGENSPSFNQILEKTTYSPLLAINLNRRRVYESQAAIARRRGARMSTATIKTPESEPSYPHLVKRTIEACRVAKEAAAAAAEGIATGSSPLLNSLRDREKELDNLDMEIDAGVTTAITQVTEGEARELLACMKVMIGLERIGDLLLSFSSSAQAAGPRLDPQDTRDLTHMATVLEKMLTDVGTAFSSRDVKKAIDVLRADAEMDRLRNLIFLRHIENPENLQRHASLQVIFMTQSLERAGDHVKNLAEEVCHFVSGHTVRHVLMTYDKPIEQMFLDWLRKRDERG